MINQIFKKYDFLYNYFETFFKSKKRFPQSIVLEGLDTLSSYFFTIELARILNCMENGDENCTCTNCRWIKEGAHPSVVSVTPIDFKDDLSKTVISVKQIEKITSSIAQSSDYHRFFIFSNAKIAPYNSHQQKKINEFNNAGYNLSKEEWYPGAINRKILQEEASNALLKSTEEAPNKLTFVFLTNTKEDIISTIVSRSLVFKIPASYAKSDIDVSLFFKNYPNIEIEEAISLSKEFSEKIDTENLDIINIIDACEEYLTDLLKINSNSRFILDDIKKFEIAKKQILASVSSKYAIESLFIALSKEGRNL